MSTLNLSEPEDWIIKFYIQNYWESATNKQLRTLLQFGTEYPYTDSVQQKTSFKDQVNSWNDYIQTYHARSNGDIQVALELAEVDACIRSQEGLKWAIANQDVIKELFKKYGYKV